MYHLKMAALPKIQYPYLGFVIYGAQHLRLNFAYRGAGAILRNASDSRRATLQKSFFHGAQPLGLFGPILTNQPANQPR